MMAISRATAVQEDWVFSWPVTRYSTVVFMASAIWTALSARGKVELFFQVERVDWRILVLSIIGKSFWVRCL